MISVQVKHLIEHVILGILLTACIICFYNTEIVFECTQNHWELYILPSIINYHEIHEKGPNLSPLLSSNSFQITYLSDATYHFNDLINNHYI